MSDLVVSGGTVLTPAGRVEADVVVRAGRIDEIRPRSSGAAAVRASARAAARAAARIGVGAPTDRGAPADRLDVSGLLVAPGFVDLQCNGAAGVDLVAEPEGLWTLATALPRWGVTAWLPTVISAPAEVRARALAALRRGPPPARRGPLARPLGLHLEGPFLAPERAGAHPPGQLRPPDPALVAAEGWSAAAGVAMVTLAPELPRALDVVRTLVVRGVVVAAGHSSASAEQASDAVDAGVRFVTHLFNAMAPLHHRDPGLAGVALADECLRSGVIADGVHLHPTTVALAARALGDRLCLVTDAVATLGTAAPGGGSVEPAGDVTPRPAVAIDDGRWPAGTGDAGDVAPGPAGGSGAPGGVAPGRAGGTGVAETAADGTRGAARLSDGTLAGSVTGLDQAVRNLVAYAEVPLDVAVRAASGTPAAALGLDDRGVCVPGAVGDLVLLDPDGGLVATIIGGEVAFDRRRATQS